MNSAKRWLVGRFAQINDAGFPWLKPGTKIGDMSFSHTPEGARTARKHQNQLRLLGFQTFRELI